MRKKRSRTRFSKDEHDCGLHKEDNVMLMLKDAMAVLTAPNGDVFFNQTGNPGLAKGGSGDCLEGTIVSFAA